MKNLNWKYAAYIVAAIVALGAMAFVYVKYISKPSGAVSSGGATGANVAGDTGIMHGIPVPKEHTTKGTWCYCSDGGKCSGKWNDCSCCARHSRA